MTSKSTPSSPVCIEEPWTSFGLAPGKYKGMQTGPLQARFGELSFGIVQCAEHSDEPFVHFVLTVLVAEELLGNRTPAMFTVRVAANDAYSICIDFGMICTLKVVDENCTAFHAEFVCLGDRMVTTRANKIDCFLAIHHRMQIN